MNFSQIVLFQSIQLVPLTPNDFVYIYLLSTNPIKCSTLSSTWQCLSTSCWMFSHMYFNLGLTVACYLFLTVACFLFYVHCQVHFHMLTSASNVFVSFYLVLLPFYIWIYFFSYNCNLFYLVSFMEYFICAWSSIPSKIYHYQYFLPK